MANNYILETLNLLFHCIIKKLNKYTFKIYPRIKYKFIHLQIIYSLTKTLFLQNRAISNIL